MSTIIIKPVKGARVLDPDQIPPRPLPAEGAKVRDCLYWRRRLAEGVVEQVSVKAAGKKNKEAGE